ncbi:hypothetical protein [Burkholderia contaminans]|uniref:hypothetical protein n=1 Tax=Burkholderia contaminans TaxID=488447 RepID=UPI00115F8027|nr:hypothetical protein [Burkholderia contaminans]
MQEGAVGDVAGDRVTGRHRVLATPVENENKAMAAQRTGCRVVFLRELIACYINKRLAIFYWKANLNKIHYFEL